MLMIGILNAYHFDKTPGSYQEQYMPMMENYLNETIYNLDFIARLSGSFEKVGSVPITSVPKTLSEVIANANPFSNSGEKPLGDLTSMKFTREGYTYELDYEYLARNSQIQNYIYLKGGDVIHLPDNSLNQVFIC